MSKVLAIAGHKGSGKSTLSNFLHGYQLKTYNLIDSFDITDRGKLIATISSVDQQSQTIQTHKGELDVTRTDPEFMEWASTEVWPYVKHYAFATPLKEICHYLFDLPRESLYGSDEDKNKLSEYRWEDVPKFSSDAREPTKFGAMTVREFMQYLGTDVFRRVKDDIWVSRTIKDLLIERSQLSIISDARFINEFIAVQKIGGKVIFLKRQPFQDAHSSETEMDSYDGYDAVIDNREMTIHETCQAIIEKLREWTWLGIPIQQESAVKPYISKIK